jgi:flagellar protein FlgJ
VTNPIGTIAAGAAKTGQADSPELAKLKKVGQQFEAVFLRQMIGSMRSASLGDGVFDSSATDQFREMSDAKMADTMAGKGALGVADLLVKQLGARLVGSAAATAASGGKDSK